MIGLREISSFLVASRIPNLVVISYTQFASAYFLLGVSGDQLTKPDFLILLLSTALIGAGGYIINDYFDQKIDMINRPEMVVVGTSLRRRLALAAHLGLSLSGIVLGFLIDPFIGAIHIFSTGALWTYSIGIKRILLLGTLTISFLTILTILIVMVFFRDLSPLATIYALFGCAAIFIRETLKDIISAKGERIFGIQSVPIVWGIRGTKVVIMLVCAAGFSLLSVYLIAVENWVVRYFFITLIPLLIWFIYELSIADKTSDFKRLKLFTDILIIAGLVSIPLT